MGDSELLASIADDLHYIREFIDTNREAFEVLKAMLPQGALAQGIVRRRMARTNGVKPEPLRVKM